MTFTNILECLPYLLHYCTIIRAQHTVAISKPIMFPMHTVNYRVQSNLKCILMLTVHQIK